MFTLIWSNLQIPVTDTPYHPCRTFVEICTCLCALVLHRYAKELAFISFLIQSEVKPKSIMTHFRTFSCVLPQLHVFALSLDCFNRIACAFCDWPESLPWFGFMTLNSRLPYSVYQDKSFWRGHHRIQRKCLYLRHRYVAGSILMGNVWARDQNHCL